MNNLPPQRSHEEENLQKELKKTRGSELRLKEKVRRSDIIYNLIEDLTSDISPEDMLGKIVAAAKLLVTADTASVILLDEKKEKIKVTASVAYGFKIHPEGIQPPLDEKASVTGWVVKNKRPLVLHGSLENYDDFKDIKGRGNIKCSLCIPLIYKDSIKGTLNLNMTTSDYLFTDDDLEAAIALGNQAAIALENSGLYKSLKDKYIEELKNAYSNLRRINKEFENAQKQLIQSEKMASVGQLASGVAHEINNPLSGVLGMVQLMRRELKAKGSIDDIEELLGVIEDSAKRCELITHNLLDFSRTKDITFKEFDIHLALDNCILLLGYNLKKSNVVVTKKYTVDLPMAYGNSNEAQQVFLNILSNAQWAIDKKPEEGGSIEIETYGPDAKSVEIKIRDTGVGMSDENKKHIFDPFYTTKPQGEGTGLGLSVCCEILRVLDGELRVESKLGEGTTCYVKLPISSKT